MRILTISALVLLSGCTTISGVVDKVFKVPCKKQVALASESVASVAELVAEAIISNKISESKTDVVFDQLKAVDAEIHLAGGQCALNEDAALITLENANTSILEIKEGL
jgi:hypothetical protein